MLQNEEKTIEENHRLMRNSMLFFDTQIAKLDHDPNSLISWGDVKAEMQRLAKRLLAQVEEMSLQMAQLIAFKALEEAMDSEVHQLCPIMQECVEEWWESVPMHAAPLYHEVMNIGFDMANGFSESQAREFHREWLDKDEENRMYNGYYYVEDGMVVNMSASRFIGRA